MNRWSIETRHLLKGCNECSAEQEPCNPVVHWRGAELIISYGRFRMSSIYLQTSSLTVTRICINYQLKLFEDRTL